MKRNTGTIIEKVYNIQGSTAGAGSGEYHRYRSMRRIERATISNQERETFLMNQQKEMDEKKALINKKIELRSDKIKKKRLQRRQKNKKNVTSVSDVKVEPKKINDVPFIEILKKEMPNEEINSLIRPKHEVELLTKLEKYINVDNKCNNSDNNKYTNEIIDLDEF